jgi:hypothetical protein
MRRCPKWRPVVREPSVGSAATQILVVAMVVVVKDQIAALAAVLRVLAVSQHAATAIAVTGVLRGPRALVARLAACRSRADPM